MTTATKFLGRFERLWAALRRHQVGLGLATALLGEPALIVLDEPTSALDPVGRVDVRGIIRGAADRLACA